MTPIHELLSRIRWDKEFGRGVFEIGYFDRHENSVHRLALREIVAPPNQHRFFEIEDALGQCLRIPFHRVREVYHDGRCIWRRPAVKVGDSPAGKAAPQR